MMTTARIQLQTGGGLTASVFCASEEARWLKLMSH